MQNKAWNEYSSSSDSDVEDNDNDSWFDDDKPEKPNNQKQPPKKEEQTTKTQQQPSQAPRQQPKKQKVQEKGHEQPSKGYEKKKFLTDQELLNLYIKKEVDDPKALKVAGCESEQFKKLITQTKTRRKAQIAEGVYLMFFETEQDLINFIKLKMEKKYRFKVRQYYQKQKDKEDNRQKYGKAKKQRDVGKGENPNYQKKQRRENPQSSQNVQKKPKRYQKQEDSDKQDKEKKQKKYQDENKPKKKVDKQQEKAKKVYLPKEYFQISDNSNVVTFKSDSFQIFRVLEELQNKKVFKNFNKIYIKTPFYALKKISELCRELSSKKKYYLEKEPPQQAEKQAIIQLTLIENLKSSKTQSFSSRFKPKVQVVEQSHLRLLGSKTEDYFKNIDKYNISEIVQGFDQNKYINLLKEMSQNIQKSWSCWKIQAQQEKIEVLLKLANRIKKSTIYDLQLKPSLRKEKALLTAELKQRPEKERRPKVDVSNVNHYLS